MSIGNVNKNLLALIIALLGLYILIFRQKGLRQLYAPFKLALRLLFSLAIMATGLLLLLNLYDPGIATKVMAYTCTKWREFQHARREPFTSVDSMDSPNILLSEYPMLSQFDRNIYDPPSLADTVNPATGIRTDWEGCLATVYVMLARGRGNASAKITESMYSTGGMMLRPDYVRMEVRYEPKVVIREIENGRPVILHGFRGTEVEHFMLAVGVRWDGAGSGQLIVYDPALPDAIEFNAEDPAPEHPRHPGNTITHMRLVE